MHAVFPLLFMFPLPSLGAQCRLRFAAHGDKIAEEKTVHPPNHEWCARLALTSLASERRHQRSVITKGR